MERLIQAIELMMTAVNGLEEVGYVHDALKKYKKLNPFIAKSNTLLADKENIICFDGYATEALELFYSVPEKELQDNKIQKALSSILFEEYKKETKALESRLDIYDSSLLKSAKERRSRHEHMLRQYYMEDAKVYIKHLLPLFTEKVRLRREKNRCRNKIETNQQVYASYSRKVLFRKNAQETAKTAMEYMEIQQKKLKEVEEAQMDIACKIQTELSTILAIQ